MNPNNPEHCRLWFETVSEMFDCVITRYEFDKRIVEFNGADENLENLARYIAEHSLD